MAEHWGQEALRPAAVEGTLSIRPQLVQANSIVAAEAAPNGAVVIGQGMRVSKVQSECFVCGNPTRLLVYLPERVRRGRGLVQCPPSPTVAA